MEVHVTLAGRGDLSVRIYRQLFDAVTDGRLRPGERLPPTREMARRLSVSRNTVSLAYERLAAEGILEGRVGAGTFVCAVPTARSARRAPSGAAVAPRRVFRELPPAWRGADPSAALRLPRGQPRPAALPVRGLAPPGRARAAAVGVPADRLRRSRRPRRPAGGDRAPCGRRARGAGGRGGRAGHAGRAAGSRPGGPRADRARHLRRGGRARLPAGAPPVPEPRRAGRRRPRGRRGARGVRAATRGPPRLRDALAPVPPRHAALARPAGGAPLLGGGARSARDRGRLRQRVPLRGASARPAAEPRPRRPRRLRRLVLEGHAARAAPRVPHRTRVAPARAARGQVAVRRPRAGAHPGGARALHRRRAARAPHPEGLARVPGAPRADRGGARRPARSLAAPGARRRPGCTSRRSRRREWTWSRWWSARPPAAWGSAPCRTSATARERPTGWSWATERSRPRAWKRGCGVCASASAPCAPRPPRGAAAGRACWPRARRARASRRG